MEPREHWRQVYEVKRPDEVSWYQGSPSPSLDALDRVQAGPDMSLVDVGAGASALADALLERGWTDITLVDISEPALEASRLRLGSRAGKVRWDVADIRAWQPSRPVKPWTQQLLSTRPISGWLRPMVMFISMAVDTSSPPRRRQCGEF